MTEHRSKNTLGRSVPIKTKTDVEEDGTSDDGSPRPVCIYICLSPNISYSILPHTTDLQVSTSSKPSEAYQYYRSPCHHLAIYHVPHYYLLQVYRSTRRQNPQKHTSTTGHHVITSSYMLFYTTTYCRSTGQHVVKTLRTIPALQVTISPSELYFILC